MLIDCELWTPKLWIGIWDGVAFFHSSSHLKSFLLASSFVFVIKFHDKAVDYGLAIYRPNSYIKKYLFLSYGNTFCVFWIISK